MIDWNAILQALLTSSVLAAIVAAGLNFGFNRRLKQLEAELNRQLKEFEAGLNKQLKEFKAELQISTAQRIGFDEERRKDYRKLVGPVRSLRKHVRDLCQMPAPTAEDVSKIGSEVEDLQKMIYGGLSLTLEADGIYGDIHIYKNKLATLVKEFENERKWREEGQAGQADNARHHIADLFEEINSRCEKIVHNLRKHSVPSKSD